MTRLVGIDIGGTKMLGVVVDAERPTEVLATRRLPTPRGTDALFDAVVALVHELDDTGRGPLGIGIPGLVEDGAVFRAGANLPEVLDVDVAAALADRTGRRVVVDNDATCAAHAEFQGGAGAGHRDGILLTLGTGIGGGLMVDGQIRHGAHGFAGEAGHMLVDPTGPRCPCGRRGCWERLASGSGLGRMGRDAALGGTLDAAVAGSGSDAEAVRGEHVVAAARAGDPGAGAVLDEFAWWVAAGIANLIDLLDPTIVVLGGGVMEAADVLLHRVVAALPPQVLSWDRRPPVQVVAAAFGERAGAIGAAVNAGSSGTAPAPR